MLFSFRGLDYMLGYFIPKVDMVQRRYEFGIKHYGEIYADKQLRLRSKIFTRLATEDYRCRLPDAKHPVIKVKMGRLDLREKVRLTFGFGKRWRKHA